MGYDWLNYNSSCETKSSNNCREKSIRNFLETFFLFFWEQAAVRLSFCRRKTRLSLLELFRWQQKMYRMLRYVFTLSLQPVIVIKRGMNFWCGRERRVVVRVWCQYQWWGDAIQTKVNANIIDFLSLSLSFLWFSCRLKNKIIFIWSKN